MQAFITILLIVLIGGIGTADVLACSDGCTSSSISTNGSMSDTPDTGCLLCHGGFTCDSSIPKLVSNPIVVETLLPLNTVEIVPPLSDIEHPPRIS